MHIPGSLPSPVCLQLLPVFESREELGDRLNRLAWALQGLPALPAAGLEIRLALGGGLAPETLDWQALPVPSGQHNYLAASPLAACCRVIPAAEIERPPAGAAQLIQWHVPRSGGLPLPGAQIIDPHYQHAVEAGAVAGLLSRLIGRPARQRLRAESRARYQELIQRGSAAGAAMLFLTGPSLEAALQQALPANRFSIICNSLVKNPAFLHKIQPDLLVFLDPAYHFGVSRYAAEFRRCAGQALAAFPDCACLVPEAYLPLAQAFLPPALQARLIGMPVRLRGAFNLPASQQFYVRHTANVLTQFMLPVGLAAANTVLLVGADGRRPADAGFWAHTASAQLGDLLSTIYAAHPSLARDEDVPGYYALHCRRVERLIRSAEVQAGRQVRSLTPSFIPALARRCTHAGRLP